jgi:microcystin-dependent protein
MTDPYLGEIRMFAGNFAPVGWEFCQGQLVPISENDALYALLGTTYGGDGVDTMGLPNLASRVPVHQGSGYPLGQSGGAESVTVTVPQLPAHSHTQLASSAAATSASPTNQVPAVWADAQYSTAPANAALATTALTAAGGSQPHDNMPPYLCVNFIIAVQGVFPSQ